VKLLLDENLSRRLVPVLEPLYPGTIHVSAVGLERADDAEIWGHARDHGFALVTKDADFVDRSLAEGPPPKVIWIRRGNCSTREIGDLLRDHRAEIEQLETDPSMPFVVLV
jgi:predicted nuclease of predicted toxin-antitoxin system